MSSPPPRFVVLKFGGTSVSTPGRWRTIARLIADRTAEGLRPVVVCSALSGISNQLEALSGLAVQGRHEPAEAAIRERHLALASELGVDGEAVLAADFEELSRLALAASLLREAAPALVARLMAMGEVLSTRLGAAFLAAQGVPAMWHDARTSLVAREDPLAPAARAYLSATCDFEPDPPPA
ncbi:MAG TPA: bifunctional aspartate kinase/diaminopimelate decarboxylase, partial [Thermoanaerobaculia bacterium]